MVRERHTLRIKEHGLDTPTRSAEIDRVAASIHDAINSTRLRAHHGVAGVAQLRLSDQPGESGRIIGIGLM